MRILVLANTPPPLHGQSLMVQALVEGLPQLGIEVRLVQMRLSTNSADIGRWRFRKIITTIRSALDARRTAERENCDILYYVPAPAKRGALYRDIIAMWICRSRRRKLVLHWHASGLGAFLVTRANSLERRLASRALGAADLSIALAPELQADADILTPKGSIVIANGIQDPGNSPARQAKVPFRVLFLGLGCREKGLWDTLEALTILRKRRPGEFCLTYAGTFASDEDRRIFTTHQSASHGEIVYAGFVEGDAKSALFRSSDLFCLPTQYPNEGQPVALIEALSHDLPIVTTRWRSIPGSLPEKNVRFVEHGRPEELASAIEAAARAPSPAGELRSHFLAHFTIEKHLASLAAALRSLDG